MYFPLAVNSGCQDGSKEAASLRSDRVRHGSIPCITEPRLREEYASLLFRDRRMHARSRPLRLYYDSPCDGE